jgi:hypothetical protein
MERLASSSAAIVFSRPTMAEIASSIFSRARVKLPLSTNVCDAPAAIAAF